MKKRILLVIICILVVIGGCYAFNSYKTSNIKNLIYLPTKQVRVDDRFGVVSLSGSWIADGDLKDHFFGENEVNTTEMRCYKQSMVCNETRALISYLNGMSGSQKYGFFAYDFEYKVTEWTENYLKAEYVGVGRNFYVTINLKGQTASIDIKDNQDNPTAAQYTDTAILGK